MSPDITNDWDTRVTDHLRNEETRNEQYAYQQLNFGHGRDQSGGDFSAFLGRNVALEQSVDELELTELQQLPEYLCDLTLRSQNSEICADHFEYWAWTGAAASYARLFGDVLLEDEALGDLCLLIQLALLVHRNNEFWKNDAYWNNPSYLAILTENYNLVTRAGYPILEGLLRRRCKQTQTDGTAQTGHESTFNNHVNGHRAFLNDAFKLWKEENASNNSVETTLSNIDDLDQSLEQILDDKFQNLSSEDPTQADGVLHFLKNLRNVNAHGETHTQAVGSIIVTLACLTFWDSLTNDDYDDIEDALKSTWLSVEREYSGWTYGFFPHGFYPLNRNLWQEPEGEDLNLYLVDGEWVIKFGEQRDLTSVPPLLESLEDTLDTDYFVPVKFSFLLPEEMIENGDSRMDVDFDEEATFESIFETVEAIQEGSSRQADQIHPLELWLSDSRGPENQSN